jgi:hypothetical protein
MGTDWTTVSTRASRIREKMFHFMGRTGPDATREHRDRRFSWEMDEDGWMESKRIWERLFVNENKDCFEQEFVPRVERNEVTWAIHTPCPRGWWRFVEKDVSGRDERTWTSLAQARLVTEVQADAEEKDYPPAKLTRTSRELSKTELTRGQGHIVVFTRNNLRLPMRELVLTWLRSEH